MIPFLPPLLETNFMINLSIQNSIPFLVPHLVPWGLRTDKEKGGWKWSRTLWSPPPRHQSPSLSLFLACRKRLSFPTLSLSSKEQTKQLLTREARECRGGKRGMQRGKRGNAESKGRKLTSSKETSDNSSIKQGPGASVRDQMTR